MHRSLDFVIDCFIFLGFLCLISEVRMYNVTKERFKDALDLSSKAAALQVDETPSKIEEGIFEIDNEKAKTVFLDMMSRNTGMNVNDLKKCMIEYKAINIPGYYYNLLDKQNYKVEYPTFVALLKVKYNGILFKGSTVLSNNFAASQLRTK